MIYQMLNIDISDGNEMAHRKSENNKIEENMIRKTLQLYRCFDPFTDRILFFFVFFRDMA